MLRTASPVTADPALSQETANLVAAGGHTFFAVPVQHNGALSRTLRLPSAHLRGTPRLSQALLACHPRFCED